MTSLGMMNKNLSVDDKLIENVIISDLGCHVYQGALTSGGYPSIRVNGKSHLAHRLVFSRTHGCISPGMVIRHTCHNKKCINIDHLLIGTQKENVHDNIIAGTHNSKCGTFSIRKPAAIGMSQLLSWLKEVVVVNIDTVCWDYPGKKLSNGYSQIQLRGKTYHLHRLVACLSNGASYEDKSLVTRHLCSNKGCINPAHLVLGTRRENALDTVEEHGKTILDSNIVRTIRKEWNEGDVIGHHFDKKWAADLNVHWSCIYDVRKNNTWTHVG